jgi:NAD dependent epimerase/dehydratase family enzyme
MKLVLAGGSGFLGTAWRDHLAREGHEVVRLVRGEPLAASESHWDPYAGHVDRAVVEGADVVANLAGAPLAHWPWTEAY